MGDSESSKGNDGNERRIENGREEAEEERVNSKCVQSKNPPSSRSLPTTPKSHPSTSRLSLPSKSIDSQPYSIRPSRIHRNVLNVPTVFKHFKSPSLPSSVSPSTLIPRSSPKALLHRSLIPSSTVSPSGIGLSKMPPISVNCDLPPSTPVCSPSSTFDFNPFDNFNSPMSSPRHSSLAPHPTTPITSSVPSSIPNQTASTPTFASHSFYSSPPSGPPLYSSHSSAPLSIRLPSSLSSFRPSTVDVPAMEANDHDSIRRYHLSMFLSYSNPPHIPSDPSPSRKSHIVHCDKTRALILRAHAFMAENGVEDLSPAFLSHLFSIHRQTVSRTISDATIPTPLNRFPPCAPPPLKQTKKAVEQRTVGKFSPETTEKLRRFMHVQFFAQCKRVTLQMIKEGKEEWLAERDSALAVNTSTIRLLLHGMNFAFVKLQCRTNIYMNDYYCRLQAHFLKRMLEIRTEGNCLIWSVDETWVHKGMRPNIGWQDKEAQKSPLTFIKNGLTAGNSAQWEKGERLVIVACLSEFGFRCPLIWRTGKKDDGGDYHKEMNSLEFERYIENVFKELVKEAEERGLRPVLLMDNASYHSRVIDKMPTSNDCKAVISDWLTRKGISCPTGLKKKELTEKLKKLNRKEYNVYVVDKMAEEHGVTLVRTPPYMAEFAPIELGWSAMKRAQYDLINRTDDGRVIRSKLLEWMENYPEEKCKSFMDYSRRMEEKRIAEGGLTFSPPSLSVEEVVAAAEEVIDEDDVEPVEDNLEEIFDSWEEEEESIRSVEF